MICSDCDYAGRPSYKSPCSECDMTMGSPFCCYEHEEKPTRADYIRNMSDEALVVIVRAMLRVEDCPSTSDCDECFFKQLCSNTKYLGRELEWLKQPMED